MKRSSQVCFAAAALAASLTLTGCGPPPFLLAYCREALLPTMGQASIAGVDLVQSACGTTFVKLDKQNACVREGQRFLNDARQKTLGEFENTCAVSVMDTVCVKGTKCEGDHNKILPEQAMPAVNEYVSTNAGRLQAKMTTVYHAKIHDVINADYNRQYDARLVPEMVESQCRDQLNSRIGFSTINVNLVTKITARCMRDGRGPGAYWWADCQASALEALDRAKRGEMDNFVTKCAKQSLDVACPKQSQCGIETWLANTYNTDQAAANFMDKEYYWWKSGYETTLDSVASGWGYSKFLGGRKFGMFTLPDWQGNTLLPMVSIAAMVGGIGCVVAAVRFARKRATRNVMPLDTLDAVELMSEDLE